MNSTLNYHRLGSSFPRNFLREVVSFKSRPKFLTPLFTAAGGTSVEVSINKIRLKLSVKQISAGGVSISLNRLRRKFKIPCSIVEGPFDPITVEDDPSDFGQNAWSNLSNVKTSNDSYTQVSVSPLITPSDYLKVTNFGFNVPANNVINGIKVEIERFTTVAGDIRDYRVRIVKGGSYGTTEKANPSTWPAVDTYASYGDNGDLWGETWTPSDINSSSFGAAIAVERAAASFPVAKIDHIKITVYHQDASPSPDASCRNLIITTTSTIAINKIRFKQTILSLTAGSSTNALLSLNKLRNINTPKPLSIITASNLSLTKLRFLQAVKQLTASGAAGISLNRLRDKYSLKAFELSTTNTLQLNKLRNRLIVKSATVDVAGTISFALGRLRFTNVIKSLTISGIANVSLNKLRNRLNVKSTEVSGIVSHALGRLRFKVSQKQLAVQIDYTTQLSKVRLKHVVKSLTISGVVNVSLNKLRDKLSVKSASVEIAGIVSFTLRRLRFKVSQKSLTNIFDYTTQLNKIRDIFRPLSVTCSGAALSNLSKVRLRYNVKSTTQSATQVLLFNKLRLKYLPKSTLQGLDTSHSLNKLRIKYITKSTTQSITTDYLLNRLRLKYPIKSITVSQGDINCLLNVKRYRYGQRLSTVVSSNILLLGKIRIKTRNKSNSVLIIDPDIPTLTGFLIWKNASNFYIWKNAAGKYIHKHI